MHRQAQALVATHVPDLSGGCRLLPLGIFATCFACFALAACLAIFSLHNLLSCSTGVVQMLHEKLGVHVCLVEQLIQLLVLLAVQSTPFSRQDGFLYKHAASQSLRLYLCLLKKLLRQCSVACDMHISEQASFAQQDVS